MLGAACSVHYVECTAWSVKCVLFQMCSWQGLVSNILYVKLLDPGYMELLYVLGHSPCNWRIMVHQNLVQTILYAQYICNHAWKPSEHFDVFFFSNCGEKVLKIRRTRRQICPIGFLLSGHSSCNWRTMIYWNVVLTVFNAWWRIYVVCGKLLELHFDASLSSNRRETVLEHMKISTN